MMESTGFEMVCVQSTEMTRAADLKRDLNLVSQKPQPCLAPPGFHRELWIAQSEPHRRCPILLGQRPTEPPTR